ncbi:4671_t:CDS:2, partial [Paraglomus occultum]
FFHSIFDKFLQMVKELHNQQGNLEKYIKLVKELAPTISELMEDEKERNNVMQKFMKYIGIGLVPIEISNCLTDGLIAICGHLIYYYDTLIEPGSKKVTLENWKQTALQTLEDKVLSYGTFQRMVDVFKDLRFKNALDFLQSHFVGAFDYCVQLVDPEHLRMARFRFLAAQGGLQPDQTESATKFRMSSPLIDVFIWRMVIPWTYPIPTKKKKVM